MINSRPKHRPRAAILAALAALALLPAPLLATSFSDPADDFLGTYTGTVSGDLDILGATARRNGVGVNLALTVDGAIGTSPGALYVWGINRGAGTPRLSFGSPSVGAGTLFDAVYVMFPNGTGRVVTFPQVGAPTISNFANSLDIDGDRIAGFIPFALLPSRGFAVEDYTYSLWSRNRVNPSLDGTNAEIADLLPGRGGFTASVPEPLSWAMLIAGFGLVGMALRRHRVLLTA
jgi:hypothetical protein